MRHSLLKTCILGLFISSIPAFGLDAEDTWFTTRDAIQGSIDSEAALIRDRYNGNGQVPGPLAGRTTPPAHVGWCDPKRSNVAGTPNATDDECTFLTQHASLYSGFCYLNHLSKFCNRDASLAAHRDLNAIEKSMTNDQLLERLRTGLPALQAKLDTAKVAQMSNSPNAKLEWTAVPSVEHSSEVFKKFGTFSMTFPKKIRTIATTSRPTPHTKVFAADMGGGRTSGPAVGLGVMGGGVTNDSAVDMGHGWTADPATRVRGGAHSTL
jgi:hypothetical protein